MRARFLYETHTPNRTTGVGGVALAQGMCHQEVQTTHSSDRVKLIHCQVDPGWSSPDLGSSWSRDRPNL